MVTFASVCFGYSCSQCAVCVTQGTVLVTFGYVSVTLGSV